MAYLRLKIQQDSEGRNIESSVVVGKRVFTIDRTGRCNCSVAQDKQALCELIEKGSIYYILKRRDIPLSTVSERVRECTTMKQKPRDRLTLKSASLRWDEYNFSPAANVLIRADVGVPPYQVSGEQADVDYLQATTPVILAAL